MANKKVVEFTGFYRLEYFPAVETPEGRWTVRVSVFFIRESTDKAATTLVGEGHSPIAARADAYGQFEEWKRKQPDGESGQVE